MYILMVLRLIAACGLAVHADSFVLRDLVAEPVPQHCATLLTAARMRLGAEPEVVIAAWNVENVTRPRGPFDVGGVEAPTGRYERTPRGTDFKKLAPWKFPAKQQKIARAFEYAGGPPGALPHFVIAPEVESIEAADHLFDTGPLRDRYRRILTPGNDPRPIDIAFAVRADLDVKLEVETHRHAKWFDRDERVEARVFTRDLPVLIVRDGPTDRPLLILIGQHAKSLRDRARGRDVQSRNLRGAQFAATRAIVDLYRARFGPEIPVVLAGDFNTDVQTAPEMTPIKERLTDAFDALAVTERATHSYHPVEGVTIATQLDAVMVSDSVKPFLRRALVLPEFDHRSGEPLGRPRSLDERNARYPSDHRAIAVVLDGRLFQTPPED